LRDILLEQIGGELDVDSPVPSERELAERYALSRMTARQAVDQLVSEGRLYRVPGRGTFVAREKVERPLHLTSFSVDMRTRGLRPGGTDVALRTIKAPSSVAGPLGITRGTTVHQLERLRTADGTPMALERTYIPGRLAPELTRQPLGDRSLYDLLAAEYGIRLDEATESIGAGAVDAADGRRLQISGGTPVLMLERVSSAAGTPVELTRSAYRADRYRLHTTLAVPTLSGPARPGPAPAPRTSRRKVASR
ncbi:MAG: GntR family transcriptional regulator, partial [Propionibacteriaceae bacterium]